MQLLTLGRLLSSGLPLLPCKEGRTQQEEVGGGFSIGNWVVWQRETWCLADEEGLNSNRKWQFIARKTRGKPPPRMYNFSCGGTAAEM